MIELVSTKSHNCEETKRALQFTFNGVNVKLAS